jgi:hypothetical protein
MSNMARRLLALEKKAGHGAPETPTCIVISSVAPGPDGPVNMGPQVVHILKGPNAGMQIIRAEGETAEVFEGRYGASLAG